jgi:hypothetical protein
MQHGGAVRNARQALRGILDIAERQLLRQQKESIS